ncbi:MAG: hypothetical protein JO000_20440 [Alphaproteobacteria bacterium]|nr:hypothetical protein [Alphaproteobacteria bacterium]
MRATRLALAALALSIMAAGTIPAKAQQDEMRARGDRACKGDAKRLCSKFFGQGDMMMLQCFQEHQARLSSSCRKFLTEVGQLH